MPSLGGNKNWVNIWSECGLQNVVYYDGLQNVVPIYDQRLNLPVKDADAEWKMFCENSMKHFEKAFAQKYISISISSCVISSFIIWINWLIYFLIIEKTGLMYIT